jgi:hypothetical protein
VQPSAPDLDALNPASVVDLTNRLDAAGVLHWDVPKGHWTILRMGYSPTGKQNGPAPVEARGLEVDKLDRGAVEAYFDGFIPKIAQRLGPLFSTTLTSVLMDSWEAGHQNWTPTFLREFAARRGYSALPYLPAMTGQVLGTASSRGPEALSDRFLEDVRRTLADLVVDHHYKAFADRLHSMGLKLYAESIGIGQPMVADGLTARGVPDVPMGEFWVKLKEPIAPEADCKLTASAAHIYGKPIAAAEAFTTAGDKPSFGVTPFMMKRVGDLAFADGINRIVIHEYAHQPTDARKPGFTLGPFGAMFNRQITWWRQGKAWLDYLARTSFLLQQGQFHADLLYYYGETVPVTVPPRNEMRPAVPKGYDFDYINAEQLDKLKVNAKGELQLNGNYKVLVLTTDVHSPAVLQKITTLIENGAVVVGPRPRRAAGLRDFPQADADVNELARKLWGTCELSPCTHEFGRGKVIVSDDLDRVLQETKTGPDFSNIEPKDGSYAFIHRSTSEGELYFVANERNQAERATFRFAVAGRRPMVWHPDTGRVDEPLGYSISGKYTEVTIDMDPVGSVFVVFDDKAKQKQKITQAASHSDISIEGPFTVEFEGLAAPSPVVMTTLTSWTAAGDPRQKFFSGHATYKTTFTVSKATSNTVLQLGQVHEFAEVKVDGKDLATLWKPPFEVALPTLKAGKHDLQVRITNLWPNRIIGDLSLPESERVTWTTHNTYKANSALLPSGWLGPATLRTAAR